MLPIAYVNDTRIGPGILQASGLSGAINDAWPGSRNRGAGTVEDGWQQGRGPTHSRRDRCSRTRRL
jgi:hypothetical protein